VKPLVTIGLPCFNVDKYIKECILSILNQSYEFFELIIINDGSTDNTDAIIRSFEDPRIKYLNDSTQRGLIYRLNQLVDLASGNFFVRMDADDIMLPYRLEFQLQKLLLNFSPNCIAISGAVLIDLNNEILGYRDVRSPTRKRDILFGVYPIHTTAMGSIMWFRKFRYDSRMYRIEDLDLWYRAYDETSFIELDKPVIFYRISSSRKSRTYFVTLPSVLLFLRIRREFFYGGLVFFKMLFTGILRAVYKGDFLRGSEEFDKSSYKYYLNYLKSSEK
jgi:glycosyltransferase involved in cell wall biosynthesis